MWSCGNLRLPSDFTLSAKAAKIKEFEMKKLSIFIVTLLPLAMLFAACAKPPTEEMDNATAAVSRAENNADAATYAAGSLVRARDALTRMQDAAASKRFDEAKSFAAEAVAAADKAIADGKQGAERIKNAAQTLVDQVKTEAEATAELISKSKANQGIKLDYDEIDNDFEGVKRSISQAEAALNASQFPEAMNNARTARSVLSDITNSLTVTATAASRKK